MKIKGVSPETYDYSMGAAGGKEPGMANARPGVDSSVNSHADVKK